MTLLTAPIAKPYTPEDLLAMPDNSGMELVDGQIVEKTVSKISSSVEALIIIRIGSFLAMNPIAEIYPQSLGFTCFPNDPHRMRKPDVTVISLARLKTLPNDVGYMPIAPDLAIEVISPNDITYDLDEKVQEYLAAGFPLIWVVDPKARNVTVYPIIGRPVIFTGDDEITAEAALPGFRCSVRDFFPAVLSVRA